MQIENKVKGHHETAKDSKRAKEESTMMNFTRLGLEMR